MSNRILPESTAAEVILAVSGGLDGTVSTTQTIVLSLVVLAVLGFAAAALFSRGQGKAAALVGIVGVGCLAAALLVDPAALLSSGGKAIKSSLIDPILSAFGG